MPFQKRHKEFPEFSFVALAVTVSRRLLAMVRTHTQGARSKRKEKKASTTGDKCGVALEKVDVPTRR